MLAEVVDAVVGVDTHRDTHHVEMALPTGTSIATCSISNDTTGYAHLLAWILDHARAASAAVLLVLECEQPHRKARRGKGQSRCQPCGGRTCCDPFPHRTSSTTSPGSRWWHRARRFARRFRARPGVYEGVERHRVDGRGSGCSPNQ